MGAKSSKPNDGLELSNTILPQEGESATSFLGVISKPDLGNLILNPLSTREKMGLYSVNNTMLTACKTDQLLHRVARGEESVAAMAEKHKYAGKPLAKELLEKAPKLALGRGTVTDYSGRRFENITALQYAVWALDWQMREMIVTEMLKLAKGEEEIREQLSVFQPDGKGLTYCYDHEQTFYDESGNIIKTIPAGQLLKSKHFNTEKLSRAYEGYINDYDCWTKEEHEHLWSEVWRAQQDAPAHVAHEYCHPRKPFWLCMPDDEQSTRFTSREPHWRQLETHEGAWWRRYAVQRGAYVGAVQQRVTFVAEEESIKSPANHDHRCVLALLKHRQTQCDEFLERPTWHRQLNFAP